MNYNKIINYCNKYNIKRYTDLGKPLTHNKLKNIINDHTNKKRNTYYEIIPFCKTSEYNELDMLTELAHKKHKPKHEPFKTLLMSYFNDELNHEDFMYNFINSK